MEGAPRLPSHLVCEERGGAEAKQEEKAGEVSRGGEGRELSMQDGCITHLQLNVFKPLAAGKPESHLNSWVAVVQLGLPSPHFRGENPGRDLEPQLTLF